MVEAVAVLIKEHLELDPNRLIDDVLGGYGRHGGHARSMAEELGLSRPVGGLLVVDWVPPRPGRTEGLMLVFDGGRLSAREVAGLVLPADELRGYVLCTVQEAASRLSPVLACRLAAAVAARVAGVAAYLEDGHPVV